MYLNCMAIPSREELPNFKGIYSGSLSGPNKKNIELKGTENVSILR